MSIQRINPGSLRRSPGLTRVVRVGDTVYISGLTAREGDSIVGLGDIDAQLDRVYGSIETALKEVGGGLDNLVKITAYTTRPEYYRGVGERSIPVPRSKARRQQHRNHTGVGTPQHSGRDRGYRRGRRDGEAQGVRQPTGDDDARAPRHAGQGWRRSVHLPPLRLGPRRQPDRRW